MPLPEKGKMSGLKWIHGKALNYMFVRIADSLRNILQNEELNDETKNLLQKVISDIEKGRIPSMPFKRYVAGISDKGKQLDLYVPMIIDTEDMANIIRDALTFIYYGDKDEINIGFKTGEKVKLWTDGKNVGVSYYLDVPKEIYENSSLFNAIWKWMRSHWELEAEPTGDDKHYIKITYKLKFTGRGAWKKFFSHKDIQNFIDLCREAYRESLERALRQLSD